ncbi:hypothetical protein [Micromonospora haikouensis]
MRRRSFLSLAEEWAGAASGALTVGSVADHLAALDTALRSG